RDLSGFELATSPRAYAGVGISAIDGSARFGPRPQGAATHLGAAASDGLLAADHLIAAEPGVGAVLRPHHVSFARDSAPADHLARACPFGYLGARADASPAPTVTGTSGVRSVGIARPVRIVGLIRVNRTAGAIDAGAIDA